MFSRATSKTARTILIFYDRDYIKLREYYPGKFIREIVVAVLFQLLSRAGVESRDVLDRGDL